MVYSCPSHLYYTPDLESFLVLATDYACGLLICHTIPKKSSAKPGTVFQAEKMLGSKSEE
jgi:hypothetical protein